MEQMLIYKERARCPAGRTGDPDVTDSFVLTRLQELDSQLGEDEANGSILLNEKNCWMAFVSTFCRAENVR
jgi:hypothetical protein